jgi:hypothetical protein
MSPKLFWQITFLILGLSICTMIVSSFVIDQQASAKYRAISQGRYKR